MVSVNETLCRRIVRERSVGTCEIRNLIVCRTIATNMSHRKARSQGGEWTPSNILNACGSGTTGCHGWIEHNPTEARVYGFRLQTNDNPLNVTVLHPAHGWVYLHDDGTTSPLTRDRTYTEPAGWADRATYTDDTAPHQIRLNLFGNTYTVGCTCGTWQRELVGADDISQATTLHRTQHTDPLTLPTQRPIEGANQ